LLLKLGTRSDEAMKRCNETLNASSLHFFASVKRFKFSLVLNASLLHRINVMLTLNISLLRRFRISLSCINTFKQPPALVAQCVKGLLPW
jgi:hypothetical protein